MTYILEKILTVREHRENKRLNHMMNCKEQVRKAIIRQRQKEKELYDYRRWRLMEEGRQFDNLKQKAANVNDLMYFTDTLHTLRREQAAKAAMVQDASNQVDTAQNTLQEARRHYARACRKKTKIKEHKEIWMEDYRRNEQRNGENEAEEIAQITFDRNSVISTTIDA